MVGGRGGSRVLTLRSVQIWTAVAVGVLAVIIGVIVVMGSRANLSPAADTELPSGETVTPAATESATSEPQKSATPVVAETATPSQPPPVPLRAAFIGDSYTQGGGADPDEARWSTVAAAGMGWTEENYGRGGTGFVTTNSYLGCGLEYCATYPEMVPEVVAAAPDVVVVAGGQNDFDTFAADPEGVRNAIVETYSGLRAGLPNAVIVAVGPSTTWGVDDLASRFDAIVREAAASVDARYVSLLDPYVFDPAVILADGHVNNDGHRAIADRVVATLTG